MHSPNGTKRRAQSHSHHRDTTPQDVDAAKALTSMLSSPVSTRRNTMTSAPVVPEADGEALEADEDAAELMMFLAHSPSPAKPGRRPPDSPSRLAAAARVLFADTPVNGDGSAVGKEEHGRVTRHSNLVLAEPITAGLGDKEGFGELLGVRRS